MRIVGALVIVLVWLVLVPEIEAQNQRRDSRAIAMVKSSQVSRLDKRLPKISFSRWLDNVVGESWKIDWEMNDCGQKDFPICVQASSTNGVIEITVMIAVGTYKRGTVGAPAVWGVWVGRKGEDPTILDGLSEFVKELDRLKKLGA